MLSSHPELNALRETTDLEASVGAVESHLAALGLALQAHDASATEGAATDLHGALTTAVRRFGEVAGRNGGVPPALRRRLALASGLVAAQRDAVARATSVLDRAMDVLLPAPAAATHGYGAHGGALRQHSSGLAQA
jgi:hypothetical protein